MDQKMEQYRKECMDRSGAVFMAVFKGKMAEGIDFPDQLCRAVFIVGIPFAPINDLSLKEKKMHLNVIQLCDKRGCQLSGDEWYKIQAYRAVNQAIGRVIRHIHDYGMIVFMDTRFGSQYNLDYISKWVKDRTRVLTDGGMLAGYVSQFFKDNQSVEKELTISNKYGNSYGFSQKRKQQTDDDGWRTKKPKLNIYCGKTDDDYEFKAIDLNEQKKKEQDDNQDEDMNEELFRLTKMYFNNNKMT